MPGETSAALVLQGGFSFLRSLKDFRFGGPRLVLRRLDGVPQRGRFRIGFGGAGTQQDNGERNEGKA